MEKRHKFWLVGVFLGVSIIFLSWKMKKDGIKGVTVIEVGGREFIA